MLSFYTPRKHQGLRIFFISHTCLEWIYTLQLRDCPGLPYSQNMRDIWKLSSATGLKLTTTWFQFWLYGWVFVYELSGWGFKSCCIHWILRFSDIFRGYRNAITHQFSYALNQNDANQITYPSSPPLPPLLLAIFIILISLTKLIVFLMDFILEEPLNLHLIAFLVTFFSLLLLIPAENRTKLKKLLNLHNRLS